MPGKDELEDYMTGDAAEAKLDAAIAWDRFAELFSGNTSASIRHRR